MPLTAEPHIQPTDAIDSPVDPAEVSGEQTPGQGVADLSVLWFFCLFYFLSFITTIFFVYFITFYLLPII